MAKIEVWHGRSLFVLFAAAALALGSARPLGIAVATALAALSFAIGLVEHGLRRDGPRLDWVGVGLLALTAFTFMQAVPLPQGIVQLLSPRAFEIHDGAWTSLGVAHRDGWFPLSLDPPATVLAGLRMFAVTLTYLTVRYRLRAHGGRSVVGPVVAAGAVVAVVFLLHRLAGWTKVYDEYLPRYVAGDMLPAPFVNANHLAGSLAFTATLAFGLAISSVDRFRRLTLVLVGALTGGACLLTLSRGGIIAFVSAQAMFVILRVAGRFRARRGEPRASDPVATGAGERPSSPEGGVADTAGKAPSAAGEGTSSAATGHRRGQRLDVGWVALGALLALSAGSYVAYDSIVSEFEGGDASKLDIPRDAWAMAADHPLAGVGRGAFIATYPPYQSQPDSATLTHPENLPIQFLAEWGFVFGGVSLVGLAFVLGRAVLRPPRRAYNAAAVAAVFGLLLQNTVDFGLELLGLALPFIAVLAIVRESGAIGDAERVRKQPGSRTRPPGWIGFAAPVAAVAALATLYPWAAANDLEAESDRFRLFASEKTFHPSIADDARGAFARHPADYYLPLIVGVHVARTSPESPIGFWNQSLRLRPAFAPTHFAVAAYLSRFPRALAQARTEYGTAVRYRPGMLAAAAAAVARITPDFRSTGGFVLTTTLETVGVLDALAVAYGSAGNAPAAGDADRALLREDPHHASARLRRAAVLLEQSAPAEALEQIRLADWQALERPESYLIGARALEALGRRDDSVAMLETGLRMTRAPAVSLALAEAYAQGGDIGRAIDVLSTLESGAHTQGERTDAVARRAAFLARWGRVADALIELRRAIGIDPGRVDLWRTAADLAERIGDIPGTEWALRELVRRAPQDKALRDRLRRTEDLATERRVRRGL